MLSIIDKTLSFLSRLIAGIPGSYYISKPFYKLFTPYYSENKEKAIRTIVINGSKMRVNIGNYMGAMIYWRGSHEWAPVWLLRKMIKSGDTFIDIGANQGEFTINAAKPVGPDGQIVAFEPENKAIEVLKHNIEINNYQDRITLFPFALGESEGSFNLYTSIETEYYGSVHEGLPTMYRSDARSEKMQEIQVKVFDDIADQLQLEKIDLIKIDVEGAELAVLKGAKKSLIKFQPDLILEFNQETYTAAGYTNDDLVKFLKDLNYNIFEIKRKGALKPLNAPYPDLINIFASTIHEI